jgi:hypothetical protein
MSFILHEVRSLSTTTPLPTWLTHSAAADRLLWPMYPLDDHRPYPLLPAMEAPAREAADQRADVEVHQGRAVFPLHD